MKGFRFRSFDFKFWIDGLRLVVFVFAVWS